MNGKYVYFILFVPCLDSDGDTALKKLLFALSQTLAVTFSSSKLLQVQRNVFDSTLLRKLQKA
jgi:hypothetical protein